MTYPRATLLAVLSALAAGFGAAQFLTGRGPWRWGW